EPAVLKLHCRIRSVASSIQACVRGSTGSGLSGARARLVSIAPGCITLTPSEKNRSPQGVISQAWPSIWVTRQRELGALLKSSHAKAATPQAIHTAAASAPRRHQLPPADVTPPCRRRSIDPCAASAARRPP